MLGIKRTAKEWVRNNLSTNESSLKISVDGPRSLGRLCMLSNLPAFHLQNKNYLDIQPLIHQSSDEEHGTAKL